MAVASSGANVQALSRSLDKVFEDAQLTGVLSLNGRNLKDFPNVASRYDLTDTVEADLSKNRFIEFPVQISDYVSLETLYLYHNCIRSIPIAVQFLESLTHLDLSRNQLQCIPSVLCTLPLEVLLLGNNRLSSIPKEVNQLSDTLTELDVSCNRLEELPAQIGDLKKLRVLNARENLLSELPYELCRLKLQFLDVSSNRISQLNVELRHMTSLVQLDLFNNPLVFPPAKLCNSGRVHIFKSLDVAFVKQTKRLVGGVGSEPDFSRRCKTMKPNSIRLIPTDPDDFKYVLSAKADRRKNRHHTVAADSGYSTLSDETSKSLRDINDVVHLRKRSPPVGEEAPPAPVQRSYEADLRLRSANSMTASMYNNGTLKDTSSNNKNNCGSDCHQMGSFAEEVMSACLERIQSSSLSNGLFDVDNKSLLRPQSTTASAVERHNQIRRQQQRLSADDSNVVGGCDDDEVSRELWRQREEYLNRKKRAGLLRMEVLQDAGESMLSPSVTNGVDLNYNNCETVYNLESTNRTIKSSQITLATKPWTSAENRVFVSGSTTTTGSVNVVDEKRVLSPPRNVDAKEDQSQAAISNSPLQNMISSTTSSSTFDSSLPSSYRSAVYNTSSSGTHATPPPYPGPKEKPFSPPPSAKSEIIQSIYNGTGSPKKSSSGNTSLCESRSLQEQPLVVYSLSSVAVCNNDDGQRQTIVEETTIINSDLVKPGEEIENADTDDQFDGKSVKRVNLVVTEQKKKNSMKENNNVTNGRGSLSSSQSSVSSSSSHSRTKVSTATSKPAVNGSSVPNGASHSNVVRKSSSGNSLATKEKVPPVPPPKTSSITTTVSVNAGKKRTSISGRPPPISAFHRVHVESSHHNGLAHVNCNVATAKTADDIERQQHIIDDMRKVLEEKLNIKLPLDNVQLAEALCDGIHLCNYLNALRPKTVRTVHLPSDAVPKLTLAKRNVENFLTGCRRLAIPENNLFTIHDVVDKKNMAVVSRTVNIVAKHLTSSPPTSKPRSPTNPAPVDHSTTVALHAHRTTTSSQRMTKV